MSDHADFELPVAKRARLEDPAAPSVTPQGSRLFSPFRTVGLISPTAVPFTTIPLGKTTFQITTSVGRSLQTYDLLKGLNLVFLSRPHTPEKITAIHAYRDRILVAWGDSQRNSSAGIWVYKRGRLIGQVESAEVQEICQILVFGSWIVGCGRHGLEVWKNTTYEHYATITPSDYPVQRDDRILTGHVCTLPTFLNKVFVGRYDGKVEIYNVSTGRLVHTLLAPSADYGAVTALSPTPALGLLAIAYADGSLTIHDVENDEVLFQLKQPGTTRAITSIAFRSDGMGAGEAGRDDGVMATASIESGDVTFWDLNHGGRVTGVLRGAHIIASSERASGITKIEFLPNQPVLISSGLDNSLKSWIFDETPFSPIPRQLHARSGHSAPVTRLKFLPSASDGSEAAGKWLMSSGQDRSLWAFSLRRDGQSTEISQGNVQSKSKRVGHLLNEATSIDHLKVPPIIDIACSLNRDGGMGTIKGEVWSNPKTSNAEETSIRGWESIVTAHEGDNAARTWSWGRKKAGRWTLETSDRSPVRSVAITNCGTFALVGSARGSIDMFNLQSGIHRQRFPPRLKPAEANRLKGRTLDEDQLWQLKGHTDGITGIVVDNLNRSVLSSSLDGTVRTWNFTTGRLVDKIFLGSTVASAMRYSPVSELASIACDDGCIRILDLETKKMARELWGCGGQIYDHCFSHDGRWIVACGMDSVVRVFDLATGHLIDAFKTATCTSLAFSSTGEFLATAHAGETGIRIWNNRTLYTHIHTQQIDDEKGVLDLTSLVAMQGTNQLLLQETADEESETVDQIGGTSEMDQLDQALLTLSLVPQSRWQTLLHLDEIRQRNKPMQPPEKPKAAPFFLASSLTNGPKPAEPTTAVADDDVPAAELSRISKLTSPDQPTRSVMTDLLDTFTRTGDPGPVTAHLSALSPAATDLEIRSLTPATGEPATFVRALTAQVGRRTHFDLVNTWMAVFLKLHGDTVPVDHHLRVAVGGFGEAVRDERERLGGLVGFVRGVVGYLRER